MSRILAAVDLRDPQAPRAFAVDSRGRTSSAFSAPTSENTVEAATAIARLLPAARRIRVLLAEGASRWALADVEPESEAAQEEALAAEGWPRSHHPQARAVVPGAEGKHMVVAVEAALGTCIADALDPGLDADIEFVVEAALPPREGDSVSLLEWMAVSANLPVVEGDWTQARRSRRRSSSARTGAGILLLLAGLATHAWTGHALDEEAMRQRELSAGAVSLEARLSEAQEAATLATRITALEQGERDGVTRPPLLAPLLVRLAAARPARVSWDSFAIEDGTISLLASAAGPAPRDSLDDQRRALHADPALVNVSWERAAVRGDGLGWTQVLRAQIAPVGEGGR